VTKPVFMTSGETIWAGKAVLEYDATSATGMNFFGGAGGTGAGDDLVMYGKNDGISLISTQGISMDDGGSGLHLTLIGSGNLTLRDFGNDATGRINVYNSGYSSQADLNAHLYVPSTLSGTLLEPKTLGSMPLINFVGDLHVQPGQVVFHS
jgi:hypothetical protein